MKEQGIGLTSRIEVIIEAVTIAADDMYKMDEQKKYRKCLQVLKKTDPDTFERVIKELKRIGFRVQ